MEKAVPIVALWLLAEMVFGAIDRALWFCQISGRLAGKGVGG